MSEDLEVVRPEESRRDFIKKSLAAGAVLWSAPVVTSLPAGRAWGQVGTCPTPPCPCACTSAAYGLRVIIPLLGIDQILGQDTNPAPGTQTCVVGPVSFGGNPPLTPPLVAASVICSEIVSQNGVCTAAASIASLQVNVPTVLALSATVLTSNASASCNPCAVTGDSNIATLTVNNIKVNVNSLTCNNDVLNLGLVVFNEQTCDDGTLNVNALHIKVPNVLEVIVAHTEAAATGCPCTACP